MPIRRRAEPTKAIDRAVSLNVAAMCAVVLVYVATLIVSTRAADSDLSRNARATVERWFQVGIGAGDDITLIMSGNQSDADRDGEHLRIAGHVGNLRGFEVFAPDGTLVRPTGPAPDPTEGRVPAKPSLIQRAGATGEVQSAIVHFDDSSDTEHRQAHIQTPSEAGGSPQTVVVEVYKPIDLIDGRTAVVRALVDVTDLHILAHRKLNRFFLFATMLAILALIFTAATAVLLTRQRQYDKRIHRLAHFDALTGVPNRAYFNRAAPLLLAQAAEKKAFVAAYMIDLDRFKAINDSLGHADGDVLLTVVANRLEACSPGMLIARLGGDEFIVLRAFVANEAAALAHANSVVEAMRTIDLVASVPASVSVSVGCALSSADVPLADILRRADAALYVAKDRGRDQAVLFRDGMDETIRQHAAVRYLLREALRNKSFELFFQPLHNTVDGSLRSFEALLRLPNGEGGYLPPETFIPIAEEMAIITEIGTWVLQKACKMAVSWPAPLSIAINVSPQEFEQGCIVERVRAALDASGLDAARLEIEVTENLFIANADDVAEKLHKLRDLGVRVVMDDFGTGYSSLQYLWKFPFDKLKVDRSCFMSLGESETVPVVLRTIRAMTRAMHLRVTAEGIETESQRAFAEAAGYDELQGYLYSRPIPPHSVSGYIDRAFADSDGRGPLSTPPAPVVLLDDHRALRG